jgi:hypothetical protein
MVGVRGFEPPTPASRTQYSTRLSYTPIQKTNRRLRLDAPTKLRERRAQHAALALTAD